MKGKLYKTEQGWVVRCLKEGSMTWHKGIPLGLQFEKVELPLHPQHANIHKEYLQIGEEVEFEIVTYNKKDSAYNNLPYDTYAKIINHISDISKMVEIPKQDVEKLADEQYKNENIFSELKGLIVSAKKFGFIEGYNKAKETLYTEEQVREGLRFLFMKEEVELIMNHLNNLNKINNERNIN